MPLSVPALETSGLWKPTLHLQRNIRGDLCHPEWRWVWLGMRFLAPLWEMSGDAQDVISGIRGTPTGTPGWDRDTPGETASFDGTPFWIFNGVSIPPARPITVLVVLRPDQNTAQDRAAAANAGTASNQAWAVWTHNITTGVGALRLTNWSLTTPEVTVGTMTAGTWYAGAMTTDRQGGTPRGAMLNFSTRALTTATGTQQTLPTQQDNPLIANAPTTTQAGGGPYQFVGALALVAWLPGVAWSERQLIQWVHDPFAFLIPARRLWAPGFVPTGQTIPVGQSLESDVAQAVARLKRRTVGQVLETDLAQPVGRIKALALVQAAESDLAQPIARLKTRLVGQVVEIDLAQPVTRPGQTIPVGQALETDLAHALSSAKAKLVAQAVELDTTFGVFVSKTRPVIRAEELDEALGVTAPGGILRRLRTLYWVGE
jgi:hypothetical protein